MKRLLLRISALGTIIALGLIAIAQAQRSSDTVVSPGSTASGATQLPEINPLRSGASQPNSSHRVAGMAGVRAGVPSNEPGPTEHFPLTAATDTGMTAPPLSSEPSGGSPQLPNFGKALPAGPTPTLAAPPQTAATGSQESVLPTMPTFSSAVGATGGVTSDMPTLAEAGMAPTATLPGSESYQASTSAMPSLDAASNVRPQLPSNGLSSEGAAVPHQLSATEAQPLNRATSSPKLAGGGLQSTGSVASATGTGRPGYKELEGMQSPQLVVEKIAPVEIQVGRPAIFEIHVRNVGAVAASNVEIRDEIPERTRLQSTKPQASRGAQGELVWKLGDAQAGAGRGGRDGTDAGGRG